MTANITGTYSGLELWKILIATNWYGTATVQYIASNPVTATVMDFQYRIYGPVYDHKESRRITFRSGVIPQLSNIGAVGTGLSVMPTPLDYYTIEVACQFCNQYYREQVDPNGGLSVIRRTNKVDSDYLDIDFDVNRYGLFLRRENRRFLLTRDGNYVPIVVVLGLNSGLTTPSFSNTTTQVPRYPQESPFTPVPADFIRSNPLLQGIFNVKHMSVYLCNEKRILLPSYLTRLEFVPSTTGDNVFFIRTMAGGGATTKYLESMSNSVFRWTLTAPSVERRANFEWTLTDDFPKKSWYFLRSVANPAFFLQYVGYESDWKGSAKPSSVEFISAP